MRQTAFEIEQNNNYLSDKLEYLDQEQTAFKKYKLEATTKLKRLLNPDVLKKVDIGDGLG